MTSRITAPFTAHGVGTDRRTTWARGISEDPSVYAYVGIEQGVEAGNVIELAGRASGLRLETVTNTVYAGQTMLPGQTLRSRNGAYALVLRGDGNLVVYDSTGTVRWATGTAGNPGDSLAIEPSGDLVLTSFDGRALWQSGTASSGADALILGNGGAARLYDGTAAVWATSKVRSPSAIPTSTVSPSR